MGFTYSIAVTEWILDKVGRTTDMTSIGRSAFDNGICTNSKQCQRRDLTRLQILSILHRDGEPKQEESIMTQYY